MASARPRRSRCRRSGGRLRPRGAAAPSPRRAPAPPCRPHNPAEPHAERDEIGAHRRFRLRPDPPGRAIIAAMPLGVGGGERRLADAAQPVQRGDRDAPFVALQRRLDRGERSSRPMKCVGTRIGMLESGEDLGRGTVGRRRAARVGHEFAKPQSRRPPRAGRTVRSG